MITRSQIDRLVNDEDISDEDVASTSYDVIFTLKLAVEVIEFMKSTLDDPTMESMRHRRAMIDKFLKEYNGE